MRKIILIVIAAFLIIGSLLLAKFLIDSKNKQKPIAPKVVKTVFSETVTNSTIPIIITANGNLIAKNRIELFSEVQGVLVSTSKDFKPGTNYSKGETLIKINADEFYANLQAQKSNLFNAITAIMPDIRMDFPSEYQKWQLYVDGFSMNLPVKKLPEFTTDKEKFFISGRGILTAYYNVKNLEVKLNKHTLTAPFNGVLTEALVNKGTLVRPGQKLGEFISPSVYEVAVAIKSEFKDLLVLGKQVTLQNLEKTKTWTGKVVRINGKVDTATQTVTAFLEVSGKDLKEGQYVEVALEAKSEDEAFEVSRNLLIDNSKLFIIKDSVLELIPVEIAFENKNSVIVKNIPNGTQILSKLVPGAHNGMLVTVYNENSSK
jgi:multidrug efflux pump subunit AcrA (membrane-fusion protein)